MTTTTPLNSSRDHAVLAAPFVADEARMHWHDQALWFIRQKRDRQAAQIPEWETLRDLASQIKTHTLSNLAEYLEIFERRASEMGAVVHWAQDAAQHNAIVLKILQDNGVTHATKSKSMLTEECKLNPYLESNGITVVDTDLGEWIVQLRHEHPSHIVMPAIHIKKEEVGQLFHEKLGTPQGNTDPQLLVDAARKQLRQEFMNAQAGITGVNFAIAESGGIVVCTNEGNADLGVSLPSIHIACMGIEKLIPRAVDLSVFTRLLARSATGQPITAYTSHFHGPKKGGQLHLVLVDNGRSQLRESSEFSRSLNCIRCGACMNTCPVYRRSGGYSYSAVVPGPIGSILTPAFDAKNSKSLPFACTLCGSCTDVCPVKIDLHHQLLTWRGELAKRNLIPASKKWAMRATSIILQYTWMFRVVGWLTRTSLRVLPRWAIYHRWNVWGKQRELPPAPTKSFRQWFAESKRPGSDKT